MDVEAAAAVVEAELDAQEWNMQEIERIQEEQARPPLAPMAPLPDPGGACMQGCCTAPPGALLSHGLVDPHLT